MATSTIVDDAGADAAFDLPDFDAFPVRHQIAMATADGQSLRIVWDDGFESRYHPMWLRENAPDPDTTHPVTREQSLFLLDIPDDLAVTNATLDERGGVLVEWSTGGASRYHPGWLRAYSFDAPERLFSLPKRVHWDGGFTHEVPRLDGPTVLSDESELGRWAEALHIYGVAILENLPATPEVIDQVPGRLGPIRDTNFGRLFDVRSKADADSNAYTSMTLPVHADLVTREYVPGLQFLHCLENGAVGGDSLLADGFSIVETIRRMHPDYYEALKTIPMGFYNKAKDTDYRMEGPFIGFDADGELDQVRWSPWLRAPLQASFEDTDRLYRALRHAFRLGESSEHQITVRLKPGDLLGFDNRRCLHGRTGFDPSTGSRWLRGCYVEREELHSRLRIVARHRRAAEVAET